MGEMYPRYERSPGSQSPTHPLQGKDYTDPAALRSLRYGHLMIMTDQAPLITSRVFLLPPESLLITV